MPNFTKTVIYHFVSQDTNIKCSYIGSTTHFSGRKKKHKKDCCEGSTLLLYQTIRDNGGWDNWTMVILEKYPCESSEQQRMREQYWIDKLNPELNMVKAFTTEEYKQEYNRQRGRTYYLDTIEYQVERKAEFYKQNKEKIDERNRLYYEKNKEKISQQRKEKRDQIPNANIS